MEIYLGKKALALLLIPLPLLFILIGIIEVVASDNKGIPMLITGIVFAIIGIIIFFLELKKIKKNPYPFTYVIDKETLINYMENEEKFCLENNLEASFNYNLFLNNNIIHIQMWNYSASVFESEKAKGVIYYFNEKEYKSIYEIMNKELSNLPQYFKIKLIDSDNAMLNEYKKNHPELKIENY